MHERYLRGAGADHVRWSDLVYPAADRVGEFWYRLIQPSLRLAG